MSKNKHDRLHVNYLAIEDLKPNKDNARVHSRKQIKQLAQCMEALGFNTPILIDREKMVIAGHGRLVA